jgi:hypothetical protein
MALHKSTESIEEWGSVNFILQTFLRDITEIVLKVVLSIVTVTILYDIARHWRHWRHAIRDTYSPTLATCY